MEDETNTKKSIDPGQIRLTGRTFDPNSPRYNPPNYRADISDIRPNRPPVPPQAQPPQVDNFIKPIESTTPQQPQKIEEDIDSLFPLPPEDPVATFMPKTEVYQHLKKKNFNWLPVIILIVDLVLLGLSLLNKAHYHSEYLAILAINFLLAIALFSKKKFFKKAYIGYQLAIIVVSLGLATFFTLHYLNTNKVYNQNYQEIKNATSLNLTLQQKNDLASYQNTVVATKNNYSKESKAFYGLIVVQIIESTIFSVILIKRR